MQERSKMTNYPILTKIVASHVVLARLKTPQIKSPQRWLSGDPSSTSRRPSGVATVAYWHHRYRDGASMTNGTILFAGRRLSPASAVQQVPARARPSQNQLSRLRSCPRAATKHALSFRGSISSLHTPPLCQLRIGSVGR